MSEQERSELQCINTIRTLSMDAVQQANSGHPGTAMAMAPVVYCLWQRFLRFDPDDPIWPNRDRFVLSIGHASMLLYAMLHLCGVKAVNPKYETLGELSVAQRQGCPHHPREKGCIVRALANCGRRLELCEQHGGPLVLPEPGACDGG